MAMKEIIFWEWHVTMTSQQFHSSMIRVDVVDASILSDMR
jgi:hypothetical protein